MTPFQASTANKSNAILALTDATGCLAGALAAAAAAIKGGVLQCPQ